MWLRDYFDISCLIQDAEFECIGLLSSRPDRRMLSFVEDAKYLPDLTASPDLCAVICTPDLADAVLAQLPFVGLTVADSPRKAIAELHNSLCSSEEYCGPSVPTMIGHECEISPLASIAKYNVVIGNGVKIEEFVSVKEGTTIGDNCILRAGVIVGGAGYEFKRIGAELLPVEHRGRVILGNSVELQQLTNVSRAVYPWDATIVGDNSKTDALVHIAHSVKIGRRTLLTAGVCIGGSSVIGDDVWIGVNATVSSQIRVGDRSRISLGAVVTRHVPSDATVSGNFAIDHQRFLANLKASIKNE